MEVVVWLTHPEVGCFNFSSAHRQRLLAALPGVTVTVCGDEATFTAALPGADIVAVWRFEQEWFGYAPRLKVLVTPAAGRDYFRVTLPPGVRAHYCAFHGELMAETVAGMILGACRGLLHAVGPLADRPWPRRELDGVMRPLRGAHVMILGFGSIGGWIGRLLKPFGVRLTGVRQAAAAAPDWFEAGDRVIGATSLDAALADVDHLVLALPGGAGTDRLLNAARLARLPARAWIYNVGRGNAIDAAALAAALTAGRIAGACLDVFDEEPLPAEHVLRRAPNAFLMPHAAAFAPNYLDCFLKEFIHVCRAAVGV